MRSTGVLLLGVALVASIGCASSAKHEPYASEDCQGNCQTGVVAGGSNTGGTTSTVVTFDSGTAAGGAGSAGLSLCTTEPTTQTTYCLASTECPGIQIDPVSFAQCGFLPGQTLDVECICQGTELCPIQVGTTCDKVASQLATLTSATAACNQVSNGVCRAISNPAGAGGASGCDQNCLAACAGSTGCSATCGCAPP